MPEAEKVRYIERERTAVRKINQALARGADSEAIFQTIIEEAVTLCDAERGFLLLERHGQPAASVQEGSDLYSQGVIDAVWQNGEALLTLDALHDPRLDGRQSIVDYNIRSVIAAPLVTNHEVIGVIYLDSRSTRRDFSELDLGLLKALADQATLAFKLGMFQLELEKQAQAAELLSDLAAKDELTGLLNRRAFNEQLQGFLRQPLMKSLCVMMLDVDNFKHYNDRNGHLAGDNALKRLGNILQLKLRDFDVPARYGGEEFIVALPNLSVNRAEKIAERLRRAVSEEDFTHADYQPDGLVTVSIGIAHYPHHGRSVKELIAAADAALYRAKNSGKNRVCVQP